MSTKITRETSNPYLLKGGGVTFDEKIERFKRSQDQHINLATEFGIITS